MKKIVFATLPFVGLAACGTEPMTSNPSWAQFPVENNFGSITARLQYLEKGLATDFDKVKVCVQGSKSLSGSRLVLETKLAYAAWVDGTGEGSQTMWDRLEFVEQQHCDTQDKNFGSAVIIASFDQKDQSQYSSSFNQVICKPASPTPGYIRFPSFDCNTNGQVLGLGGPNGAYVWGRNVRSIGPSTAILTPYAEWVSLERDIEEQLKYIKADTATLNKLRKDGLALNSRFAADQLEQLLSDYQALRADVETVRFSELVAFSKKMAKMKYQTTNNIRYVENPFVEATYRPEKTAYHTLLHEVGHQFGMAHAHSPQSNQPTGASEGAKQKNGIWTTDEATMAYAYSYTFLTEDDRLGIADLWKRLDKAIDERVKR